MMAAEDEFLARVKSALGRAGHWKTELASEPPRVSTTTFASDAARRQAFAEALAAAGATTAAATRTDLARHIVTTAKAVGARTFAVHATPLMRDLSVSAALRDAGLREIVLEPRQTYRRRLMDLDLAVSDAVLGVAETGSIVLASSSDTSRLVTAMAHWHIAVLPADRIVANLGDVARWMTARSLQSEVTLLTGPTRTGDIEGEIILGAHGAYEVHVIVAD